MNKLFALVDCNNFYVSCERVFNPKLNNIPVVILSNNDGCVVSRSAEAKQSGIEVGTPFFECERLFKKKGGVALSSNYTLYADISRRVMEVLSMFSPEIEFYSIDEAFLSLTGFQFERLAEYCQTIKSTVCQWVGIPVSIGIGNTKTLAKTANKIAKRDPVYGGVYLIDADNDAVLETLPVADVWGVGSRYTTFLNQHMIFNAKQFKHADDKLIRKNMTITGSRTQMELRGISCIKLEEIAPPKKAIVSSRSFGKPVESFEELKEAVAEYTGIAASKLRKQKSLTQGLSVYIMTDTFKNEPQYANSVFYKLPIATSYPPDLIRYAHAGLQKIYLKGFRYIKAGIMLTDIVNENDLQFNLFIDPRENMKKSEVMHAIDAIQNRYGHKSIFTAAEGISKTWSTKRSKLTPCYTTRWEDLPVVK